MNKINEFLKLKKLDYRENDTHIQLDCFICSDTRTRLGIEKETGKWNCFHCSSRGKKLSSLIYAFEHKGNIRSKDTIEKTEREQKCKIKPNLHIKYHKQIFKNKSNNIDKYLREERGISREAMKYFKLGHRSLFINSEKEEYEAGEHLSIPYLVDDKCVNIKYRAIDPDVDKKFKWRREKGGISALYNDQVIDDLEYNAIYIAESELDCISLWELGIKNVIGLTTGAEGFSQTWYERLNRFEKIYLVLDNDIAGQEGAKKVAKRLGMGRCWNIVLPEDVKDPNDYLLKHDLESFNRLANKAKRFDIKNTQSLKTIFKDLYNKRFIDDNEEVVGYKTQWPKINRIMGSLKPGYLVVVSGKPKTGKSSLSLNLMESWSSTGINVGMYSCEMRTERIGEKFIQMVIPNTPKVEEISKKDIKEADYVMASDNLFFYYPEPGDLEIEKVCSKIKEMVQRYGLKVFIFDNLHFLCRGADEKAMVDIATQSFKLLAESLDIVFILVTHPRKTNNNLQLKVDDLKGSGSIFQDADLVWLMHRSFNDGDMTPDEINDGSSSGAMSNRTEMSFTGRWTEGGQTFLVFNGQRSLFKDSGPMYREAAKELSKKRKRRKSKGL